MARPGNPSRFMTHDGGSEGKTGQFVGRRREPMTMLEVRDVLEWMARVRAGWQAAAAFAGRPEHDVRMACDPDYARRHAKPAEAFRAAQQRRREAGDA